MPFRSALQNIHIIPQYFCQLINIPNQDTFTWTWTCYALLLMLCLCSSRTGFHMEVVSATEYKINK